MAKETKEEIVESSSEEKATEETKETDSETKEESTEEKVEETQEKKKEKPERERKDERYGIAHISSSSNNTLVHITDLSGNTISRITGGMVTKHSRLKANPTIAMFVAKRAAERAKDLGITSLYIKLKGRKETGTAGPGAHAAVKSLGKEGFRIVNILDSSTYPRGGPKVKGGKRGRRV